jgi:hypothetical protein
MNIRIELDKLPECARRARTTTGRSLQTNAPNRGFPNYNERKELK